MKRIVLPISTFAVGFLIAFLVFKLSFTKDLDKLIETQLSTTNTENIKPKSKEDILKDFLENLAPQRKELIANITPLENMIWNKLRKEKELDTINEGDEIWANGNTIQERFDEDIVNTFAGEYHGILGLNEQGSNNTAKFNIKIVFKGTKTNDLNTISFSSKDGNNFSTTFSSTNLGFDPNNVQLIITWANQKTDPFYYMSHFAFKIPLLQTEQTGKYTLYGLDGDFEWREIGEVELKRIK